MSEPRKIKVDQMIIIYMDGTRDYLNMLFEENNNYVDETELLNVHCVVKDKIKHLKMPIRNIKKFWVSQIEVDFNEKFYGR